MASLTRSLIVILFILLSGCRREPSSEPILFSKDVCHHCKMVISDRRFGAELVTEKGKVLKYDSIECMGHDLESMGSPKGTVYVVNSFKNDQLIKFKDARFFHDANLRSPMGKGIFAAESSEVLSGHNPQKLTEMNWQQILRLIGRPELVDKL